MAEINTIQPNFSGLASLAGSRTGYLNIATPKDTGMADFGKNLAAGLQQGRQNSQAQAQQAVENNRAQQQLDLTKQNTLSSIQDRQQTQSLAQQQFDMQKKQFDVSSNAQAYKLAQQHHADMLQGMQTGSMYFATLPQQEWDNNRAANVDAAVKSGMLDSEVGKQMMQMPYNQMTNIAKQQAILSGKGKDYVLYGGVNPGGMPGNGTATGGSTQPGSSNTPLGNINSIPTQGNVTKQQANYDKSGQTLQALDTLTNEYKPSYLGAAGAASASKIKNQEWYGNLPVVGKYIDASDENKQWYTAREKFSTDSQNLVFQYLTQISGSGNPSSRLVKAVKPLIPSPDDSESEFMGKSQALKQKLLQIQQTSAEMLQQGYKPGTPQYYKELQSKTGLNLTNQNQVATDNDVQMIMKRFGVSKDAAIKNLQDNGHQYQQGGQ